MVREYPPERAAQICGVDADTIREVARLWGETHAGVIYWGMGISQHTTGTDNARCLIAMCAITGNVGKPGAGLHPLRGQNNVQGASDAGLIPMMFPDYQRVDNAKAQEKFREAWGVALDDKPRPDGHGDRRQRAQGRRARDVHDGREPVPVGPERQQGPQGARRARVPRGAGHLPHGDGRVRRRGAARDLLPGEGGDVHEHRPARADRPQGPRRARPGAAGLGGRLRRSATGSGCRWSTARRARCSTRWSRSARPTRTCDYDNLGPAGKLYPNADPEHSDGTVVLFGESFATDDGKAHLVPAEWMPAKELPDEEFPFVLNTGRLLEHWHTGSMTRRSFALDAIQPEAKVFIGFADAERLGVADGDFVRVTSRRGSIELKASLTHRETPGSLLHPLPLPRGGGEPADDRRDRPVREDPRVQVLRRADRADRRARGAARGRAPGAPRARADGDRATSACRASRRAPGSSPGRR